jgi:hypothetical protein
MGYIFGVVARRHASGRPQATRYADVAELVDALVSGTSGSNVVGVQVSPSALHLPDRKAPLFFRRGAFFCQVDHSQRSLSALSMLVLKISNASEVVASKLGKFLEALTPDSFDQATIEDVLIKELIKNLAAEGLKGEVAAVNGLDLQDSKLVIEETLHVRRHQQF